jgi:hypothetical protein
MKAFENFRGHYILWNTLFPASLHIFAVSGNKLLSKSRFFSSVGKACKRGVEMKLYFVSQTGRSTNTVNTNSL